MPYPPPEGAGGSRSILFRQEDREDTRRHRRVGRIGRPIVEIVVVAIDFPEDRCAGIIEAAEIVLAVWVVVGREGIEGVHALHNLGLLLRREGRDAGSDEDATAAGKGSQ